jgi:hypothetical protein
MFLVLNFNPSSPAGIPPLNSINIDLPLASPLKALLPTPTRSHYTFNLRDLSRIFQGMQTAGSTLKDTESVVRLWVHETLRVCADRLIDDHDREWFAGTLKTATEDHFRIKWCAFTVCPRYLELR